ncbi:glycerol-3-phosphate dehydrogenase [Chloroflexi bacterium TSY]|nr:glycerol-3-phosphate dehydrogenase [Chloroflexi bacterium TSY]
MANILILGAGVMGSAFSVPLTDNGHQVQLVGTHLDDEIIEQIHEERFHPRLGVTLSDQVTPYSYDRLGEALEGVDLVVLGVNSLGIDWVAMMLGPLLSTDVLSADVPLLFLTKGLEGDQESLQILPQALRKQLPAGSQSRVRITAVGGPSIAGELASRRHASVVVAGEDQALLTQLADWIRTPYYHVWTNTDMIGVEVCVALKNVYALAVGLAAGLLEKEADTAKTPENHAQMHNPAAAIFAQGIWETAYLVDYMGGTQRSVLGMPGVGDLYVTCQGGRNSRMGRLLGLGMRYTDAKVTHMPDDTIEGAELALAIGATVEKMVYDDKLDGTKIPLLRAMINIVCNDQMASLPWDEFFV